MNVSASSCAAEAATVATRRPTQTTPPTITRMIDPNDL